jgi:hypothetical protein
MLQFFGRLYTSRNDSDLANEWNRLRRKVIRQAVVDKLIPQVIILHSRAAWLLVTFCDTLMTSWHEMWLQVMVEVQARLLQEARECALGKAADE